MFLDEDSHKDVKASFAPLIVASKTSLESWPCALAFNIEMLGRRTDAVAKAVLLETGTLDVYGWTTLTKSKVIAITMI